MDWSVALSVGLVMVGGWLGIVIHRRRDKPLSRRQVWIRVAVGIYGLAVLTAIAVAGSKF